MQTTISVIIPVYNAEQTLARCLDSLLPGCSDDMEIILVNDGSTDGSGAMCAEYAERDPRIRFINQKNGGVSTARNAGLDAARGTYICFVDSDDYVTPECFSIIRRTTVEENWDLIRFSHCVDNGESMQEKRSAEFAAHTRQDVLPRIIDEICSKALNSPWAKVYRRDIIERYAIRFPVGASVAEDRAFNIAYSLYVNRYLVSTQVIYCVSTCNTQSLSRKQHSDLHAQFRIADKYITEVIEDADIPEKEKEQYRRAINFGICRSIYRDAKELHRNKIGWFSRQTILWKGCREINRKHMRYPNTRYCRLIVLPVQLRLTPAIDLIAWKLLRT